MPKRNNILIGAILLAILATFPRLLAERATQEDMMPNSYVAIGYTFHMKYVANQLTKLFDGKCRYGFDGTMVFTLYVKRSEKKVAISILKDAFKNDNNLESALHLYSTTGKKGPDKI